MEKLKKVIAVVALTLLLALPALADCEPPAPGQIPTPPCSAAQSTSDSTDPGQTSTPPAADSVDVVYIAEAALAALLIF